MDVSRDRVIRKLIIGSHHDSLGFIHHPHKILGFGALIHFISRWVLYMTTGSMHFSRDYTDLWFILGHFLLPISSFIFPIKSKRNFSNQIIWRELQLHNIVFSSRSCAIFTYIILTRDPSNTFARFIIVMAFHLLADLVSYLEGQGSTVRDSSWDFQILPAWTKSYFKKFYAIAQMNATVALIFTQKFPLEYSIMILFTIQLSAFLMTLRLKGIINNDVWHIAYSISLALNYTITSVRNDIYIFMLLLFGFFRIQLQGNKYIGWCLVFAFHYYFTYVNPTQFALFEQKFASIFQSISPIH